MAKMAGIFVNENGIRYADAIIKGYKVIETRNRDMLRSLVGKRVAIVRTKRGKLPMIVGYVDIVAKKFVSVEEFGDLFDMHLVPPGSYFDAKNKGKWCYYLENPEKCDPFPLPTDAVRHGMSWCEYEDPNYVIWTVHTIKN